MQSSSQGQTTLFE
jgi:hypothetical protein